MNLWRNEGRERTIWWVIVENKLTAVFHASVLLLTINFVITLSKSLRIQSADPQLLWQCYKIVKKYLHLKSRAALEHIYEGRSSKLRYFSVVYILISKAWCQRHMAFKFTFVKLQLRAEINFRIFRYFNVNNFRYNCLHDNSRLEYFNFSWKPGK